MADADLFLRVASALPPFAAPDDEDRARASLRWIVERVPHAEDLAPIPADPATCPNCGEPADSLRSPYCSPDCREMAAFVRQFRGALADGSIFDPHRQLGLGQALWHLQGGGYPLRQRLVPPRVLAKVIERDGGLCAVCGAPATEVDHTGSG